MHIILVLFFAAAIAVAEKWVIQLAPGTDPTAFARAQGFSSYDGPVAFLDPADNFHVFSANAAAAKAKRHHQDSRAFARHLRALPQVRVAEEQVARRHYKRIADPLYEAQWHLHTHPYSVEADLVRNATGRGVTIAIVDDGLQHTHPDLQGNYDAAHSWDFNDNDADPTPVATTDGHGTAAAGKNSKRGARALPYAPHRQRNIAASSTLSSSRCATTRLAWRCSDATLARSCMHGRPQPLSF